jgi:hypothetical protein
MENTTDSKIINLIKNILKSESLKEKYNNVNKDIFIIIEKIIDKNPTFFIFVEEILLELVKDNEINLTIFNCSYFTKKIKKLFTIYNEIKLDELSELLNINNFSDLLKFLSTIIFENNKENIEKCDEIIIKINNIIDNFIDFIKLISNEH